MSQSEYLLGFLPITGAQITGENTAWVEVMVTGEKLKNGGKTFTITQDDLETYAADIRDRGPAKRIPIDYDHSYAEGGGTLAAGWFTGQADIRPGTDGPSLWAEIQWTPKAADAIRAGEYAYISPEFSFQTATKEGVFEKARRILAAGLTNRPFFDQMAPIHLASKREDGHYEPIAPDPLKTSDTADGGLENDMTEFAITVRKSLGLPDDADDAAVTAAIAAKDEELEAAKAAKVDLEKRPAIDGDQMKALIASAAKGEQAAKDLHEIKREQVLTAAISAGKILPVQKDAYATMYDLDAENVVKLIDATPERSFKAVGSGAEGEKVSLAAGVPKGTPKSEVGVVVGAELSALVAANLSERGISPSKATSEQYLESVEMVTAKTGKAVPRPDRQVHWTDEDEPQS